MKNIRSIVDGKVVMHDRKFTPREPEAPKSVAPRQLLAAIDSDAKYKPLLNAFLADPELNLRVAVATAIRRDSPFLLKFQEETEGCDARVIDELFLVASNL